MPKLPERFSPACLWQVGIFETLRSEKRKIVALEEHLDRLLESAHASGLSFGHSRSSLRRLLVQEASSAPTPAATLRVAIFREGGASAPSAGRGKGKGQLSLIVKEAKRYPHVFYEKGVSIRTSPTRRNAVASVDAQLKVRDFLNGVLATLDSDPRGESFEEIYLNADGYVTEGRISNIFLVREGTVITPPTHLGVLRGITRDQVVREAARMKIPVREEPFTRVALYTAEEVFLTNTSMGVMPVVSVDGRTIGDGKTGSFAKRLLKALRSREGKADA